MFKAKLINNKAYHKLRSRQFWLVLIPSILIGMLANFYRFPFWENMMIIAAYIVSMIYVIRNQNLMNSMLGQKRIEIDDKEIRIKSARGNLEETILLTEVDQIVVQKEYGIPQDSMKEITGNLKKNHLIIHHNNEEREYDFEIDSHYMITQLNKVIESWSKSGLKIEKI